MPIKIQTLGDYQSPLAQRFGVPAVSDVQLAKASPDAVARLSAAVARSCRAVPIAIDQGALIVAFADPGDREALESPSLPRESNVTPRTVTLLTDVAFVRSPQRMGRMQPLNVPFVLCGRPSSEDTSAMTSGVKK